MCVKEARASCAPGTIRAHIAGPTAASGRTLLTPELAVFLCTLPWVQLRLKMAQGSAPDEQWCSWPLGPKTPQKTLDTGSH